MGPSVQGTLIKKDFWYFFFTQVVLYQVLSTWDLRQRGVELEAHDMDKHNWKSMR